MAGVRAPEITDRCALMRELRLSETSSAPRSHDAGGAVPNTSSSDDEAALGQKTFEKGAHDPMFGVGNYWCSLVALLL
eukprot:scaffold76035_cov28-Tisochrysis_lutea.AAC.3